MSLESPVSIIFNSDGYEVSVVDGALVPAESAGLLIAGTDGTNVHYFETDSSGRQVVVGAGTAGTPVGGVLSIQGVSGGQAIPISGTVTATNASTGTVGASVPSSATLIGASDGIDLQALQVVDLDTGGGTDYHLGVSIRLPANGGSVAGGTTSDPFNVAGTVTVTQGTASNLLANVGGLGAAGAALTGNPVRIGGSDGTNTTNIRTDSSGYLITVGAAADGAVPVGNPVLIAGWDGTNVQTLKTSVNGALEINETKAASSAVTSVAATVSNTTLLASNSAREGATLFNDSNRPLYVKLGTTASTASFTVKVGAQGYYEVPASYTGQIDALWGDPAIGSVLITELT